MLCSASVVAENMPLASIDHLVKTDCFQCFVLTLSCALHFVAVSSAGVFDMWWIFIIIALILLLLILLLCCCLCIQRNKGDTYPGWCSLLVLFGFVLVFTDMAFSGHLHFRKVPPPPQCTKKTRSFFLSFFALTNFKTPCFFYLENAHFSFRRNTRQSRLDIRFFKRAAWACSMLSVLSAITIVYVCMYV